MAEVQEVMADDDEVEAMTGELDAKRRWVICPICEGEGSHVNPNIDSNGLSADDFAEDPDFAEEYMAGTYDVGCSTCAGSGKILAAEWEDISFELSEAANDRVQSAMEDGQDPSGLRDYRYGRR